MTAVNTPHPHETSTNASILITHAIYNVVRVHFVNLALGCFAIKVMYFPSSLIEDIALSVKRRIVSSHSKFSFLSYSALQRL